MSSSLKRPSNDDNQEDTWDNNQAQNEGANNQGNSQQQDPETTEDPGEDTTQNPAAEQVSTTEATAPARRPKKPRRDKNSPEPNYSELVQGQMSSTNRTGQACDRCKVSLPEFTLHSGPVRLSHFLLTASIANTAFSGPVLSGQPYFFPLEYIGNAKLLCVMCFPNSIVYFVQQKQSYQRGNQLRIFGFGRPRLYQMAIFTPTFDITPLAF
ncbi:hypothetical protein TRV_04320 [Trichophyton verrucosum HKI 0517]|uniref:Uncharacterized protein n=1 Tax=Trichophyton verrucosum (strain HKI 0517) TaxID=663202 RepID=D4DB21_TRIVH|nr:uncharacterized protein TRV_04320 [Trichophyton verrucosum HKI 0517]EFE40960.1 hypothetical protein TRV_04320 [Trichophyton verrucosum HKI 0517]